MTKAAKLANTDLSRLQRSVFKVTFVVEVLGVDVWEDFKEGHLELGPYVNGVKIQYQLYPGQSYDVDIVIWPHVAKIWCGGEYCWVRTWQLLQRRWLTFSISHAFPVRVTDLRNYTATVNMSSGAGVLGASAKNDKNFEVWLPPLGFGVRRYFAPVSEGEEPLRKFIENLIWKPVEKYIPSSCFDGLFDVPHSVSDIRHQDAAIDRLRELILKKSEPEEQEQSEEEDVEQGKRLSKSQSKKKLPDKTKKVPIKFEITLPGETLIAGTGRVIQFETVGDQPPDTPDIIVLITSNNLPAQDDLPIVFVNIENLFEVPVNELKKLRITHLYTKWKIGETVHCSQPLPLKSKTTINFNDHQALPIPYEELSKITSEFLDKYTVELRGKKLPAVPKQPKLFGFEEKDRDFVRHVPSLANEELDFLIAVTKIDGKPLAKGLNSFLKSEFPLYPPAVAPKPLDREGYCTNDINSIRTRTVPDLIVKPDIILQSQMCLELSIGVVGCKTRKLPSCYSRMFCSIKNTAAIMEILRKITEINEEILLTATKDDLMSGFALDTGNVAILYLEGPRDGYILQVWYLTEDFYPDVKPNFSCSARYSTRIYPELLAAAVPFIILKMFVPLGLLLACPPTYARPTLPLPTRSAVLKIGRLLGCDMRTFPSRCQMPTTAELKSFRLELCVAPRPTPVLINDNSLAKVASHNPSNASQQNVSRINWDNK